MRNVLTPLFAVALTTLATLATAQEISDPGCAAIEDWVAPLSTARGRMGGAAHSQRGKLVDQIFTDATTEALFGFANSRWQQPQYEAAGAITARCLSEAESRKDLDLITQLRQANGRIQDRIERAQAAGRMQGTPRPTNTPTVSRPDCEALREWASVLMTQEQRRSMAMEGKSQVEVAEQRKARLLSDAEITPRFGSPLSEWTYNDYMYASTPINECAGKARAAGDQDAYFQLHNAYGIIRRRGNELR